MNKIVSGIMGNTLRRYLIIALVASLAITGGMFAYAYTTTTTTLTISGGAADYAAVTANTDYPNPAYTLFGKFRGALPAGYLFNIDPTTAYPGDLAVNVYLSNIDELGKNYGMWMMRIELVNSDNDSVEVEGVTKILSMRSGVVSFTSENMSPGTPYHVRCDGGVYVAHPWNYISLFGSPIGPELTCEVLQAAAVSP